MEFLHIRTPILAQRRLQPVVAWLFTATAADITSLRNGLHALDTKPVRLWWLVRLYVFGNEAGIARNERPLPFPNAVGPRALGNAHSLKLAAAKLLESHDCHHVVTLQRLLREAQIITLPRFGFVAHGTGVAPRAGVTVRGQGNSQHGFFLALDTVRSSR
jgi:hypothetical protein